MERRSIPYAVVPFVVLALWAWILPWINDQVAWDDPIKPGEAIEVAEGVSMTAAPGWGVVEGLRTTDDVRGPDNALTFSTLVKDGVVFSVLQGPFTGTPAELLEQAEVINAAGSEDGYDIKGDVTPETTASGLRGVSQHYATARSVGTLTTFVVDDTGLEIQVVGPQAQMKATAAEVANMIDSIATDTEETP